MHCLSPWWPTWCIFDCDCDSMSTGLIRFRLRSATMSSKIWWSSLTVRYLMGGVAGCVGNPSHCFLPLLLRRILSRLVRRWVRFLGFISGSPFPDCIRAEIFLASLLNFFVGTNAYVCESSCFCFTGVFLFGMILFLFVMDAETLETKSLTSRSSWHVTDVLNSDNIGSGEWVCIEGLLFLEDAAACAVSWLGSLCIQAIWGTFAVNLLITSSKFHSKSSNDVWLVLMVAGDSELITVADVSLAGMNATLFLPVAYGGELLGKCEMVLLLASGDGQDPDICTCAIVFLVAIGGLASSKSSSCVFSFLKVLRRGGAIPDIWKWPMVRLRGGFGEVSIRGFSSLSRRLLYHNKHFY